MKEVQQKAPPQLNECCFSIIFTLRVVSVTECPFKQSYRSRNIYKENTSND